MVSKRSVYDNLSGLTLGCNQRNPLIYKGFRLNDCGPDGTPIICLFMLFICYLTIYT